jgi:hypothetical protein
VSLSSARTITAAVNPPRAAFVDFPLGHTSGKANEPELQRAIVRDALTVFETATVPGTIVDLAYRWSDDDSWKVDPLGGRRSAGREGQGSADSSAESRDTRTERFPTPQYQTEQDRALAAQRSADDQCLVCVGIQPEHLEA